MAQGMTVEEDVLELVVDKLGRGVLVALYLVAHHLALFLHLGLGIGAVKDDVEQHVDGLPIMLALDGTVEDGVFLVGEGVQLAAQTFDIVDDAHSGAPLRPLEGEVLAEMGQSLLVGRFVAGAGMYGDAAIDDRGVGRQVDDTQACR